MSRTACEGFEGGEFAACSRRLFASEALRGERRTRTFGACVSVVSLMETFLSFVAVCGPDEGSGRPLRPCQRLWRNGERRGRRERAKEREEIGVDGPLARFMARVLGLSKALA